ncbi:MAG: YkgJ family cysteine cluster protein [Desulfosalsimonadaceae bacterium]
MDFTQFFERYEALAAKVEEAFKRVSDAHPDLVLCKPGCTDCCYALFDLTLVEALYINQKFNEAFTDEAREKMLEKANKADRQIYKLKKEAYQATKEGKDETAVVEEMGKKRIQCPLLNDNALCDLYPHRPLACRIYGVPLAIGGAGRTCGLSGFEKGNKYPTVNMDIIHEQLLAISTDLVRHLNTKRPALAEVLVPVSMAILTDYDKEYLGIPEDKDDSVS